MKLNSKQLRKIHPEEVALSASAVLRNDIILVLENIYDTYNIGGLFRLADGLGVAHMYLTGDTTPPPNNRIHKASCGTYKVVPWTYVASMRDALEDIRLRNPDALYDIVAVEQSATSIPYTSYSPLGPVIVIVGNETNGVTPETLKLCDSVLEIPMWGINKSLNVIVSAGIVSYHLLHAKT
jgi:tRNA G18 (ribose-2'-O)-methylase SpoU